MAIVGRAVPAWQAIVALCLAVVMSPAKGQVGTVGQVAAGTVACPEREAAADIMSIVRDIEAEDDPARRLMLTCRRVNAASVMLENATRRSAPKRQASSKPACVYS